ncbi:hypothetical protein HMPREF0574_0443 [Mobiluncus curtisii subsp. curtisii ATCC 35241]|uniref:Uncharacterized protein n=1 Tax=Mobiluncus holmesii ATCC 35242 TaxID=887899 RepID=E6M3U7_9ACTO|nr:hypothetical protein HMPREF0574_0443 [Mobiluncus curtisii subsp. curtisii ATCC 35241]EFU82002.1 hypothetical protein HMPREF0576_0930 [Mobiluncus holmesii ATCC 35242]
MAAASILADCSRSGREISLEVKAPRHPISAGYYRLTCPQ